MGNCCECNKNSIDDGNIGGKIQYQNQVTREDRFRSQSKDNFMPNSANGNLSGFIDLQQTNNDTTQKDPDAQIPIKPPKVPHDKIPDSIINSKKKLKLIIKQSKYLSEGREFIINAGGLVGSPRNAKDGVTIFGDAGNNHKNDFEFPEEESKTGQSHAEIKYDRNLDQYQVKSLRGSGCFLKIDKKILLETGDLFSFSNFLIQVNIEIRSEEINNRNIVVSSLLTLEVLFGDDQRRKITFDSKNKKEVRIGRLKNSETDFTFADEDVSRKQCILTYEDNNWYINDGDGHNESSNGTWFYPEKYFTITEGMIIRMGTTSFECRFEP